MRPIGCMPRRAPSTSRAPSHSLKSSCGGTLRIGTLYDWACILARMLLAFRNLQNLLGVFENQETFKARKAWNRSRNRKFVSKKLPFLFRLAFRISAARVSAAREYKIVRPLATFVLEPYQLQHRHQSLADSSGTTPTSFYTTAKNLPRETGPVHATRLPPISTPCQRRKKATLPGGIESHDHQALQSFRTL